MNNGQSAAKPLNLIENHSIKHEERSTTISEESRDYINSFETGGILIFPYKIYGLVDPRTNKIRYIGQTRQLLETRLTGHISESLRNYEKYKKVNKREAWIYKLNKLKLRPIIYELYKLNCEQSYINYIEKEFILLYKQYNDDLLNDDDHGINLILPENQINVHQYSLNGEFIKSWLNANIAGNELNINDANIGRCCKNEQEQGQLSEGGYYWSFIKYNVYPIKQKIKSYKKVYKFDLDKNLIKIFNSAKEASENEQINYKYFCSLCNNAKIYKNYIYSYFETCSQTKTTKNKQILCYSLDNVLIKEYNSATEAAKDVGLANASSITQCCKGKQKTAKNYIWKYKN